jgi:protein-S-isoprenylcysteine O-methyltransferase Ste14
MTIESIVRWCGGLFAFSILALLLLGVWRGTRREVGRTVGLKGSWLRSSVFYLVASAFFFGIAWLGWIPLPISFSHATRTMLLIIGALLYFPGLALVLWGRLALGKNYFVSTGLGVQLFKGQQLVTTGPYAIVRHPMYLGLMLAALGSLLVYMTWTTVYFACVSTLILLRSRREEEALAAEFGEQWRVYCKHVKAFLPNIPMKKAKTYEHRSNL